MKIKEIDLDNLITNEQLDSFHGRVINELIGILLYEKGYSGVKIRTSKKVSTSFLESMTTGNISGYETINGKTTILITYPFHHLDPEDITNE